MPVLMLHIPQQLLVQGVRIVNGILLLSPSCVTIKGHSIEELVEVAQVDFEQGLRARLGYVDPFSIFAALLY